MNYLKHYCNLIRKAEKRGYTKKKAKEQNMYVEGHHTFPVSIFGKNKRIVYLTAREHYIAHALLEKAFIKRCGKENWKSKKMIYAFWRLNNESAKNTYSNSYLYEKSKSNFSKLMASNSIFLKNNPSKSPQRRRELSQHMKQFITSLTEDEYKIVYKKRIEKTKVIFKGEGNPFYNKKHTEEVKNFLSELSKESKWWNNGKENRRCKECPGGGWIPGMYYENNHLKGKKRDKKIIEKVSNSNCKYVYIFTNPKGEKYETINARKFCLENQLQHSKITMLLQGKREHHKGWKVARRPRTDADK